MDPQLLKGGFSIGALIVALSLLMLPFQPRGSAEFVVTVLSACVGGLFLVAIAALVRWSTPPLPRADDKPAGKDYNVRQSAERPNERGPDAAGRA
jgi:hypothetical protein